MYDKRVTAILVLLCLFNRMLAKRSQTCEDLVQEMISYNVTIEALKQELLEYKMAAETDVSDECNKFETCRECLQDGSSPNCGWCFLYSRCTFKENCPGSVSDSNSWIAKGGDCPRITGISPRSVAYNRFRLLELSIPNLPKYDGVVICSFEAHGKSLIERSQRTENGVSCPTPHVDSLPKIPEGNYSLFIEVSVRTPHGPNFVTTTDFSIYDCSRHDSCTECASSPHPCAWCMTPHRCTADWTENCRNDILVHSIGMFKPSLRKGPEFCSRISPDEEYGKNLTQIVIPTGSKKRIVVAVKQIIEVPEEIFCKVEDHKQVKAQLVAEHLFCAEMQFHTINRSPVSELLFNVYWQRDGRYKLDNPENIHVVVYDCFLLATNCGMCLELPEKYNCGWCEDSNACLTGSNCYSGWLDRNKRCTKSVITSFYPKSGLSTRETNITIEGENLGKQFKDIDGGVSLVNDEGDLIAQCTPYKELYVTASRIVCRLDIPERSAEINETSKGFFEVKVFNEFIATSEEEFSFVNPLITGLTPVKGIKSGGTHLEVRGLHMDAGSKVEVFIGELPCKIISRDTNAIRCKTSPSDITMSRAVRVLFDGEERSSPGYFFYVEDPWINRIKTGFNANRASGTPSGGNLIIVEGAYFDHIQNSPYIYVLVAGEEYIGPCRIETSDEIMCLSPRIPAEKFNFCNKERFLTLDYGFMMDEVKDVLYYSTKNRRPKFHLYPDPVFMPFREERKVKHYKSDYLTISGNYLDNVFNENDITIEIGMENCRLTSLSNSQLTCRPPTTQPLAKDGDQTKIPEVVVKVAGMEFFIGFLHYDT